MKNKKGKRKVSKLSKKRIIIRTILYFMIGLVTICVIIFAIISNIIWHIIKNILLLVSKVFDKVPKTLRGGIILGLVFYSIFATLGANNKVLKKEIYKPIIKINILDNVEAEPEEKEVTCQLSEIECKIYAEAMSQGLTDYESKIALSISKWETGKWTSSLYKNNNFGGLYYKGHFKTYLTQNDGIRDFIKTLRVGYFSKGKNTLEKIQVNYCPVGAKNDPTGLNNHWLKGTSKFLKEYESVEILK